MLPSKRQKRVKAIKRIRDRFGKKISSEVLFFKSGKYIYAQVFDLVKKQVVFASSSLMLRDELLKDKYSTKSIKAGEIVGKDLAKKCLEKKISLPSLNRNSYPFHGIVAAFYKSFCDEFGL